MSEKVKEIVLFCLVLAYLNVPCCQGSLQQTADGGGAGEESNIILLNNIRTKPKSRASNQFDSDDIRCYCNLPSCISNSYMCRTARSTDFGGCFSERKQPGDKLPARHGCLELLLETNENIKCENHRDTKKPPADPEALAVICCHHDMCNHVDNPKQQLEQNQHPAIKINSQKEQSNAGNIKIGSLAENMGTENLSSNIGNDGQGVVLQDKDVLNRGDPELVPLIFPHQPSQSHTSMNSNNQLFFNSATIIVPILGAIIIFVVVMKAMRMLKNDTGMVNGRNKLNGIDDCCSTGMIVNQSADRKWSEANYYDNSNSSGKSLLAASLLHSPSAPAAYQPMTVHNNTNDSASLLLKNDKNNKVLLEDCKVADKNDFISLDYRLLPQHESVSIVNNLNKGIGLNASSLLKPNLLHSSPSIPAKCECFNNSNNVSNNNLSRNYKCNHCNVNVKYLNEKSGDWN